MSRLGSYSGERVVKAFQKAGWRVARQRSSHVILEKEGCEATLSVPSHKGKNVKRGTLRDLIKDAGMSVNEFRLSGNLRGPKLQLNQEITSDLFIYLAIDLLTKQRGTAVPHIICMKILVDI